MNEEILIKYLNDSCTDKELEEFFIWMKDGDEMEVPINWSFDYWNMFEPELKLEDKRKYKNLLDKIHHEIYHQHSKNNKLTDLYDVVKWLGRVAAIWVTPIWGIIYYFLSDSNFQIETYTDLAIDSIEVIMPGGGI